MAGRLRPARPPKTARPRPGWRLADRPGRAFKEIFKVDLFWLFLSNFSTFYRSSGHLRPNYGHNAYRGTTQNLRPLRSWLVLNPKKRLVYNNYYQFTTPYPYQPKRKISSWSEEFYVANRFSDSENSDEVSVVFTTKVDDSFIMNPYASDDIFTGGNEDVAEEREIFKFEPEGTYYLIIYKDELNTMGL